MSSFFSISEGQSDEIIEALLQIDFPEVYTILDLTYGKGRFWNAETRSKYRVIGCDIDPDKATDILADFRYTFLPDENIDVVVFDPPYISNPSKSGTSLMAQNFSGFKTVEDLQVAVTLGTKEAWRLCKQGIIVKVQNHIHGQQFIHMTKWVQDAINQPLFDEVHNRNPKNKLVFPGWKNQLSVWKNHTTYLVFKKGHQRHTS